MSAGQDRKRIGLMALVVWGAVWMVLPTDAADDPAALRRRPSARYDLPGDDLIKGEIKALLEDPKGTRGLLAEAARAAKEKDPGFTYNGAYILAWTALQLRELETSRTFFRICAEEGSKLQSAQKLVSAYSGLMAIIEVLYQEKKYEKSVKLAQEFLELLEKQGVSARIKAEVYRQMIRSLAKQGKVEDAKRLVETLVKAREDWQNYEIKAWLEQEVKHFDEAAKTYEQALKLLAKDESLEEKEKEESQDQVRRELLRALAKAGKIEEAHKVIDELKKGKGSDWQSLELKAWLQQETGHPDQAAKTYE